MFYSVYLLTSIQIRRAVKRMPRLFSYRLFPFSHEFCRTPGMISYALLVPAQLNRPDDAGFLDDCATCNDAIIVNHATVHDYRCTSPAPDPDAAICHKHPVECHGKSQLDIGFFHCKKPMQIVVYGAIAASWLGSVRNKIIVSTWNYFTKDML
jgi:hypothetical protein